MAKVVTLGAHGRAFRYDAPTMNDLVSRIYNQRGARSLKNVRKAFGLNLEETAALFHVTRQAITKWEVAGVPSLRLADVDRVAQLAEFMQTRLRKDRLPALVRTQAADFDGRTVLQVIRDEGAIAIVDYMHRLASGVPR